MEEVRGSSPISSTHNFPWSGDKRISITALCLVLTRRWGAEWEGHTALGKRLPCAT